MAPVNEDCVSTSRQEKSDLSSEDENLWLNILSQVQESSPNKLASCKTLLVLGDNESGKTSLIAKLQGNEDPKKGSGIEYHCIYVRDEYRDDHTRLSAWVLDGDPWHKNLLKFALNEESFPHTTVLLVAAMTEPWDILDSLHMWAAILEEHIGRLRLARDVLLEYRRNVMKRFQEYGDLSDEIESITSPLRQSVTGKDDPLPIDDITLFDNLGLDIIVAITKTDYMSTLEKEFDYKEEHFDFIQQAVRKFCLKYGASLFYISVKEDKNCDLLFKYLVHRIYSFPFKAPALVVEKDAIFIPAGWDNKNKISILYENLATVSPDDPYSEVILKPMTRKPLQREAEVVSEDDQTFLSRQQNLLSQQVPASVGRPVTVQESPIRSPAGVQKTSDRRLSGSPGVQASPKKLESKPSPGGGEGVLQNFFNSLLNRRTGPPMVSPTGAIRPPDKTAVRHDAAAELDRMTRTKKPAGFSPGAHGDMPSLRGQQGDMPSLRGPQGDVTPSRGPQSDVAPSVNEVDISKN